MKFGGVIIGFGKALKGRRERFLDAGNRGPIFWIAPLGDFGPDAEVWAVTTRLLGVVPISYCWSWSAMSLMCETRYLQY